MKKETTALKGLTFKKYQLQVLAKLLDTPLHGQEMRSRTRFLRKLMALGDEVNDTRKDKLIELAEKNEDGSPKMMADNPSQYDLSPESLKKFQEFYKELMQEHAVIDILASNVEDIRTVYNILVKLPTALGAADAEEYELLMEAFEANKDDFMPTPKAKAKK